MFDSPPPGRGAARESKKFRVTPPQQVIGGAFEACTAAPLQVRTWSGYLTAAATLQDSSMNAND